MRSTSRLPGGSSGRSISCSTGTESSPDGTSSGSRSSLEPSERLSRVIQSDGSDTFQVLPVQETAVGSGFTRAFGAEPTLLNQEKELADAAKELIATGLRSMLPRAVERVGELMEAKSEAVALKATEKVIGYFDGSRQPASSSSVRIQIQNNLGIPEVPVARGIQGRTVEIAGEIVAVERKQPRKVIRARDDGGGSRSRYENPKKTDLTRTDPPEWKNQLPLKGT